MIDKSRQVLESNRFRFTQIMPNMIEEEALYRKSLGVTSDIVLKEMYYVNATGSEKSAKSKLVLRPEGTAGVLRSVLNDPTLMK